MHIAALVDGTCPECGRALTEESVLRSMANRVVPARLVALDIVIGVVLLLSVSACVSNMGGRHASSGAECVVFAPLALLVVGRFLAMRDLPSLPRLSGGPSLADYLAEDDVPCPMCKYNLRGLKSNRCPECDHSLSVGELLQREFARVGLSTGESVYGTMTGLLVWVSVMVLVFVLLWVFTTWWAALAVLGVLAFWRAAAHVVSAVRNRGGKSDEPSDIGEHK